MAIRKQFKNPLLGFGWAGYLCAAILFVLIAALVAGVELRYELLKIMPSSFGVDGMMFFVRRLPFLGFSIFGLSVSVVTGAAILFAFKVAPYRVRPLFQVLVFLLCTSWFVVVSEGYIVVNRSGFGLGYFAF